MKEDTGIVETKKGKAEYTLKGTGEPVLMLHGSLQNCNNNMGYDVLLNSGFSIISPSRPGYGRTPADSGRTAEGAADLMAALLDYLKIGSANVIASSYGGPTGIYLASKYPERVKKLVLASAVSKPIDDLKRLEDAKKFYGKGHKLMWGMLRFIGKVSNRSLVKKTFELFSTCNTDEIMKEIKEDDIRAIVDFYDKKPENTGALIDLEHIVPVDVLNKITVPVLIVHSKEDRAVPFSNAEFSKESIKGSELYTAGTWGHFVFVGKGSEDVLKKIADFFNA